MRRDRDPSELIFEDSGLSGGVKGANPEDVVAAATGASEGPVVLGVEAALVLIRTSSSWSTSMEGTGGFRVF